MSKSTRKNLSLALADKPVLKEPAMYTVVLLNDDFTPMDFVIEVLNRFFQKSAEEATRIMLTVHHQGRALCGVFPYDIAQSKVQLVRDASHKHGHPLHCTMEKKPC
ncbi:MAG: ATP-dependent Clp protease adapter ClpS [Mariprofundaceae bacterium]